MTKLYQKSEITFAILWIVAYVVLSSYADQLSESIGIIKSATAVLQIAMSLVLFFWIRSNVNSALGWDQTSIWLPGCAPVCDQYVLCRFFGRGYLPRTPVPGNGKRQPENSDHCILVDFWHWAYRQSFQRKRKGSGFVCDPDYICCSGRVRARIDLLLRKIAGSVYHFPFSQ